MIEINDTFIVKSTFTCEYINEFKDKFEHDPIWRKTSLGCLILHLLRDMFNFNITYVGDEQTVNTQQELIPRLNNSVDIYIEPMELRKQDLDTLYPIQCIFMWRFGFILRRRYNGFLPRFYSEPFANSVWICIYVMILIGSLVFYVLSVWESVRYGAESSFVYELLLAFSAYCQHILPLQAVSNSRRIAYFSFIMGAYIIHTFYTSNFLTHLVMDTDEAMGLESLVKSNYEFAIYKDLNLNVDIKNLDMILNKNLSIVYKKLTTVKVVSLNVALNALMEARTAVMTDYIELYSILKKNFEMDDICHLTEIDLYSNVQNYLFTSKSFHYKESFKIGTLRIKEAGLIRRHLALEKYSRLQCKPTVNHYNNQWEHSAVLLTILLIVYTLAVIVMIMERIYYKRNRVWPYIE